MNAIEQLLAALAFCGLLAALVWIARTGRTSALGWVRPVNPIANALSVIARRALTPHHVLYLISIAGKVYIVGTHPQGMQMLSLPTIRPAGDPESMTEQKGTT
jgi:flagellar biogenesis protein FliO